MIAGFPDGRRTLRPVTQSRLRLQDPGSRVSWNRPMRGIVRAHTMISDRSWPTHIEAEGEVLGPDDETFHDRSRLVPDFQRPLWIHSEWAWVVVCWNRHAKIHRRLAGEIGS